MIFARFALIFFCIGTAFAGCRGKNLPSPDAPFAKVWISKEGNVELNGQPTSLEAIDSALKDLAQKQGVLLYGRETAEEEPHANSMKVIELAARNRLPIRMSTQRDFSDALTADGKIKF